MIDGRDSMPTALLSQGHSVRAGWQRPRHVAAGIRRLVALPLNGDRPAALSQLAILRRAVHVQVVKGVHGDGATRHPSRQCVTAHRAAGLLAQNNLLLIGVYSQKDRADRQQHLRRRGDTRGSRNRRGEVKRRFAVGVGGDRRRTERAQAGFQIHQPVRHRLIALREFDGEGSGCSGGVRRVVGSDGNVRSVGLARVRLRVDGGDNVQRTRVDDHRRRLGAGDDKAIREIPDGGLTSRHLLFHIRQAARRGVVLILGRVAARRIVQQQPAHPAVHHLVGRGHLVAAADVVINVGAKGVGARAAGDVQVDGAGPLVTRGAIRRPPDIDARVGAGTPHYSARLSGSQSIGSETRHQCQNGNQ